MRSPSSGGFLDAGIVDPRPFHRDLSPRTLEMLEWLLLPALVLAVVLAIVTAKPRRRSDDDVGDD
jgi:hypothetical protein